MIFYGDNTTKGNGHSRDMHYGKATMPYSEVLGGYPIPGVKGRANNYISRIASTGEAERIIKEMDRLMS